MFGVKKSNPALAALLNALASVLITVATALIIASSNAALMRIGSGNDVAKLKLPDDAKDTPGLNATPCCPVV